MTENHRESEHMDEIDLDRAPRPAERRRGPRYQPKETIGVRGSDDDGTDDVPAIDLGAEMLRVELQDLLTDDPASQPPRLEELLRFVYRRGEMTREERIAVRMRINASASARKAYLKVLRDKTARGGPAGVAEQSGRTPPEDHVAPEA